jgi:quinate/shikimate dehydrogenase (NAD+)
MERALLGLVGSRIGRSISPAMHEAAGRAIDIDVRYHLIDADVIGFGADALPRLLNGVRLAGFAGVNVTYPFKEAVVPWLDSIEGAAEQVGAVNTVIVRDGRLVGHNTDYSGFISGWKRAFGNRRPGVAALIGAGGVGRAIAHALVTLDAEAVRLWDIEPARARTLAETLRSRYPAVCTTVAADAREACAGAAGIVNATPVGMYAFPGSPVPDASLSGIAWAMDAVYTPLETTFIASTRRAGAAIMTGQELAIGQAIDAFELFFNRNAPEGVMRDTFLAAVAATVTAVRNER